MTDVAYKIFSTSDIVLSIDGAPVGSGNVSVANIAAVVPGWGVVYDENDNPALGTQIEDDSVPPVVELKRDSDGEEYIPTQAGGEIWLGGRPSTWPWLV